MLKELFGNLVYIWPNMQQEASERWKTANREMAISKVMDCRAIGLVALNKAHLFSKLDNLP